jgi:hypothetical protein
MSRYVFQETIRKIRADWKLETDDPKCKYPIGRMKSIQKSKGIAVVDCGGERKSTEYTLTLAKRVLNDDRFLAYLKKGSVTACIERYYPFAGKAAYQVRIRSHGDTV